MRKLLFFLFAALPAFGQTFPTIATGGLNYTDATTLTPAACASSASTHCASSYQDVDYDPAHGVYIFYPFGTLSATVAAGASGVLLQYASGTWTTADLTLSSVYNPSTCTVASVNTCWNATNISPWGALSAGGVPSGYAWDFAGGISDGLAPYTTVTSNPTYYYTPPGGRPTWSGGPSAATQGSIAVQINAPSFATDPQNVNGKTYKFMDLQSLNASAMNYTGRSLTGSPIPAGNVGGFGSIWVPAPDIASHTTTCSGGPCPHDGYWLIIPTGTSLGACNSVVIRYDGSYTSGNKDFTDPTAWDAVDTTGFNGGDSTLCGSQSGVYMDGVAIFLPFVNGNVYTNSPPVQFASKVFAWTPCSGTAGGCFHQNSAWAVFDTSTLNSGASRPSNFVAAGGGAVGTVGTNNYNAKNWPQPYIGAFTGGVIVPSTGGKHRVIMAPWGDKDIKLTEDIVVMYDAGCGSGFTSSTCWSYLDTSTVSSTNPGGYQGAWLDKHGYVWLEPTQTFTDRATRDPSEPPFLLYNTAASFSSSASWKAYPYYGFNGTGPCSVSTPSCPGYGVRMTGVAYDTVHDQAMLATYGFGAAVGGVEEPYNLLLTEAGSTAPSQSKSPFNGIFSIHGVWGNPGTPVLPAYTGPAYVSPALPTVTAISTRPAVTGATTAVHSGANLQTAINSAACGDRLVLDAGATWSGNYVLTSKSCTSANWVQIVSSGLTGGSFPAAGYRIATSQLSQLANICTTNSTPALASDTAALTSYYWIEGIHLSPCSSYTGGVYQQFFLGAVAGTSYTPSTPPGSVSLPHDVSIAHSWIQGGVNQDAQQEGIIADADNFVLIDSIVSDIQSTQSDSTGIEIDCSHGNDLIQNNEIAGLSEGILMAAATCPAIPTNMIFRHNYNHKQTSWTTSGAGPTTGGTWVGYLKNEFEVKNGQKMLYDQNICTSNDTVGGQSGTCYVFTPRTDTIEGTGVSSNCGFAAYTWVGDITVQNSIAHDLGLGSETAAYDNFCPATNYGARVLFNNILVYNVNVPTGNYNYAFTIDASTDVTLLNSTLIDNNTAANCTIFANSGPMTHFVGYKDILRSTVCGQGNGGPLALIGTPGGCGTGCEPPNTPGALDHIGGYGAQWSTGQVTYWESAGENATNIVFDTSTNPFNSDYSVPNTSPLYGLGFDPTKVNEAHVIAGTPN